MPGPTGPQPKPYYPVQGPPLPTPANQPSANQQQIANENKFNQSPQGKAAAAKIGAAQQQAAVTHIRDMQTFLKNRGYNIGVDGIRGPQTNAAVAAFHNHISAQAFNARYASKTVPNGSSASAKPTPPYQPGKGTPVSPSNRAPKPGIPDRSPTQNDLGSTDSFNPLSLANAETNAQYDPSIMDLQNQLTGAGNQNTANQASLKNWYAQMQNLLSGQLTDVQGNATQSGNAYAQALGNDAQLFGGAQAPQVGAAGQNGADALSAVNQAQQDYLNNMGPLLKAQGAQASSDATNAYNQQSGNLHSQLQAQQQAKGQAFTTNYQNALQTQTTDKQNQAVLNQAAGLYPYQLASAKSQAQTDASNAAAAPVINQATLQKDNAQIQQVQSSTQKNLAEAQAAITKGASFAPGSKDRTALIGNLYKSMINSAGTSIIGNPVQAQKALYTQAVAYGLIKPNGQEQVPGAATMLSAVLQNVLASTPSWRSAGWQWNGKTFVQTKK